MKAVPVLLGAEKPLNWRMMAMGYFEGWHSYLMGKDKNYAGG